MSPSRPSVVFHPLHADVAKPTRQTEQSAGYDLHAYLRDQKVKLVSASSGELSEIGTTDGLLKLEPGDIALVPTGFKARVPDGYEAQIRIRSSMAFRRGLVLPNAPGTIDSDYPDEWLVMVKNDSSRQVAIEHGERIAQAVLAKVEVLEWKEGMVGVSTDRKGGFGSTGARDEPER